MNNNKRTPAKRIKQFHYVPQLYLKRFALESGKVRAIDRRTLRQFLPNTKNVCQERDYYLLDVPGAETGFPLSADEFFTHSLEPSFDRIMLSIELERRLPNEEECYRLSEFAIWQFWRSPLAREMTRETDIPISNVKEETVERLKHMGSALKSVMHLYEVGNFSTEIFEVEGDALLPSSDQPSLFCGIDERDRKLYFINSFSNAERYGSVHFGMPINPRMYIFVFPNHVKGKSVSFHKTSGKHLRHLIKKIACGSRRYIFDPSPTRIWRHADFII